MPRDLFAGLPRLAEKHAELVGALGFEARDRRALSAWPLHPRSVRGVRNAHVGATAFSLAATQFLGESGIEPDLVFGHSLGIHAALAAARAVRIADALEIAARTAEFLAVEGEIADGAMYAVTGFTPDEVAEFCESADLEGEVFIAIINSRRQVVVSGSRRPAERLVRRLKAKGAWGVRRIPINLPLHTPLMESLADDCAELVEGSFCHVPHVDLLHPTTATPIKTVSGVERLWRTHLLGMIDFVRCLEEMDRLGVASYIEVGIGETLGRFGRWFRRDLRIFSIGRPGTMENLINGKTG